MLPGFRFFYPRFGPGAVSNSGPPLVWFEPPIVHSRVAPSYYGSPVIVCMVESVCVQ